MACIYVNGFEHKFLNCEIENFADFLIYLKYAKYGYSTKNIIAEIEKGIKYAKENIAEYEKELKENFCEANKRERRQYERRKQNQKKEYELFLKKEVMVKNISESNDSNMAEIQKLIIENNFNNFERIHQKYDEVIEKEPKIKAKIEIDFISREDFENRKKNLKNYIKERKEEIRIYKQVLKDIEKIKSIDFKKFYQK